MDCGQPVNKKAEIIKDLSFNGSTVQKRFAEGSYPQSHFSSKTFFISLLCLFSTNPHD